MKRLQTSDPLRTERRRGPDLTQRAPRGPREPRVGSAACASAVPEGPASERRWPGDPGPRRPPDPKPRELWHLWGSCYRGTCTFKLSCMPCIVSQSGNKDFIKTQRPCDQEAGRRRSREVCLPTVHCPPSREEGWLSTPERARMPPRDQKTGRECHQLSLSRLLGPERDTPQISHQRPTQAGRSAGAGEPPVSQGQRSLSSEPT